MANFMFRKDLLTLKNVNGIGYEQKEEDDMPQLLQR